VSLSTVHLVALSDGPNYEMVKIIETTSNQILDAQLDSKREQYVWVLLSIPSMKYYAIQAIKDKEINEDHLVSPTLLKNHSFEPITLKQYFNSSLDFEFIFLFSCAKVCLLARNKPDHKGPFAPSFVVDFLDSVGMMRRGETLNDFCGLDDFKWLPKSKQRYDPLEALDCDEQKQVKHTPLNRKTPFDIDDDIVILPNFKTR